ncbi:putative Fe-S cluster assembly protein SufT [Opitutales bacterium ASA1]|uniref:putative Fe-S cluster assembly protein SufT n=1 Tax=Congregicoccus parvus TaxID=3081749 RepID=UPI002B28A837|nr:putative Fe-S cluster assembly protein SufT [Opitutales bacterium ASA1]
MSEPRERILSRDTPAVQIPSGQPMVLAAGARVYVTQTLGGSFTVMTDTGLARIAGEHADAIGEEDTANASAAASPPDGAPTEEQLWSQLRNVYDPEIPVNIVDLGLVYSLEVKQPSEQGGYKVEMQMTLTAPGCGMGPAIAEDARNKLLLVPGVDEADVHLVWEPPWNQGMISEEGRMKLGLV